MAEIRMGAQRQHKTLSEAVAAADPGDTIYIDAGIYLDNYATINKPLTLVGVGGMAHFHGTKLIPNNKGIIVTSADLTVQRLEFSGARVADENGAGIRYHGGTLIVRDSSFHDNQEGILGGADADGRIEIHNSSFVNNGNEGDRTHGLYAGRIESLLVSDSLFQDTYVGSHLKSRAANTEVYNSRFIDGDGPTNYGIDISDAGDATIVGNYFEQAANTNNKKIISYGSEAQNPGTLTITENTLVNYRDNAVGIHNRTSNTAFVEDNVFVNLDTPILGQASAANNLMLTLGEYFDNAAPVAANDTASLEAGDAATVAVLANDSDPDGDALDVAMVGSAAHGSVVDNGDGTLTYTPDSGFVGDDSFTYTIDDGNGGSDSATVAVTVAPVQSPPPASSLAPDQIAGLRLWLDAADAATLVDSNGDGRLNRWLDKSGNGHSVTAPSGDQQPGLAGGLVFDGGNDVLAVADAGDLNLASTAMAKTLTLAFTTGADVAGRQVLYEQGGSQRGLNLYIEDGEVHLGGWNLPGDSWGPSFVSAGVAAGATYVATLTFNATAGTVSGTLNGVSIGTIGGVGALYKHGGDIGIGRMQEDSLFESAPAVGHGFGFGGTVHEVAIHNRALGGGEQAGLHGHLLDKWTAPPPASLASDLSAGLSLWLDGADAATLVDSNGDGRLNQWLDKSGAGHTATAPAGSLQPVLADGAAFDGSDGLTLADAGDLNLASTATAKTLTLVFSTGADVAGRQVLYEQGGSQRGLNLYIEDGEVHLGGWNLHEDSWGPTFVGASVAANTAYVATLTLDAAAGTLSGMLNGADIGSIGGVGALYKHGGDIGLGRMDQDSLFESGGAIGDGFGFDGTLHEAAFYNRALDSQERVALAGRLAEKWNIDGVELLGVGSEPTADDFGLG